MKTSTLKMLVLGGILLPTAALAQVWTAPTSTPPGANASTPINVSGTAQVKSGGISLGSLIVTGGSYFTGNVGIGTTEPSKKLHVVGGIRIEDGSEGSGKVLTSDANGAASWQAAAAGGSIPAGAVMSFNRSTCPSGWTEFTNARGRYIVGLRSDGTLRGTVGTALSDKENRATGGHFHRGSLGVRGTDASDTRDISPQGGSGTWNAPVSNGGSDPGPSLPALVDTVAGTNAPYIQLLMCEKD